MSKYFRIVQGVPAEISGTCLNPDGTSPDLTGKTLRAVAAPGIGDARALDVDTVTGAAEGRFTVQISAEEASIPTRGYNFQLHVMNGDAVEAVFPTDNSARLIVTPQL